MANATELPKLSITENFEESIDTVWVLLTTYIILTMQSGFGLLESGMVSRKSESNVMVKNMIDVILGGLSFWLVGYAFSFGSSENPGIGSKNFLISSIDIESEAKDYRRYFSQLSFATTATTIVSGAVADRVNLKAYMIFAFIFTGFIYPLPAHWIWNENGWLSNLGVYDFAGCSVVHISGGAAALVSCYMIGPRINRFGTDRDLYFMASPTNVMLGTLFLWWGWLGFNCGSTFAVTGGVWKIAARAAINTMNGAIGGGLFIVMLSPIHQKRKGYLLDIPNFSTGILGGLVAITAIASSCETWEALIIGFLGGIIAIFSMKLVKKLRIDDPVGVIGVHLACGWWGMIAVGIFGKRDRVVGLLKSDGLIFGRNVKLLLYNLLACLVTTIWSGLFTGVLVLVMNLTIRFRMTKEQEIRGADDVEHNVKDALVIFEERQAFGKRIKIPSRLKKLSSELAEERSQKLQVFE